MEYNVLKFYGMFDGNV